jgi:phosphoglycerol transferase MdoB-like AlkP superfamily enzyme
MEDGSWGIYDGPFLQRFADQLNHAKQPFFSTLFTISSHHPYSIPPEFTNRFSKGTLPIHESIGYTDYSLREFFRTVSQFSWFDSTLFIITADHTALSEQPFYQSKVGMYAVPVIFYQHHSDLKGISLLTTQQADIFPSILNYLHFDQPFFSFGESVFDSAADHFAVNYLNDSYQIVSGNYSLSLDTMKENYLYDYTTDSLLQHNLVATDTLVSRRLERKLKALIQNYNNALIRNKMTAVKIKNSEKSNR